MRWAHTITLLTVAAPGSCLLQRWEYWPPLISTPVFTGTYISSHPDRAVQKVHSFQHVGIDLFHDTIHFVSGSESKVEGLLYGSVLYRSKAVKSPNDDFVIQRTLSYLKQTDLLIPCDWENSKIVRANTYTLALTGDNGASEMIVLLSYMDAHSQYRSFEARVIVGHIAHIVLEEEHSRRTHRFAVNFDREMVYTLFQHTFYDTERDFDSVCEPSDPFAANNSKLRVLTYNVWNTNPSDETIHRWEEYNRRMDALTDAVKRSEASIIGFQEVRFDASLGHAGDHAQIQHLANRLPNYQYVYQAAMHYIDRNDPLKRVEEGLAIFSRYPILSSDYILLHRDPNDPNDQHQRICLHAVVYVPDWGRVDVYVTHLSLSKASREQSVIQIWNFMQTGNGVTQLLLGDLNAEPQSEEIQFLQGKTDLLGHKTNLRDSWLDIHDEPVPRSKNVVDRSEKFTFPSEDPCKRIDLILFRGQGVTKEIKLVGKDPFVEPSLNGIKVNTNAIYPSDHRGVIAEFE
ncbi:unnamed protein product [Albugo candida]|uniref:Endonuclease/exonuclease/phosphatase domain-containing protein n=1 Tax=Albugo candida TaxID=65357 RepID=A0A024GL07_9STRA|nr:unnamed protein product [Albugo candida]|eukprot:CCI47225.1 unnamed protein product [Albugo candida]